MHACEAAGERFISPWFSEKRGNLTPRSQKCTGGSCHNDLFIDAGRSDFLIGNVRSGMETFPRSASSSRLVEMTDATDLFPRFAGTGELADFAEPTGDRMNG